MKALGTLALLLLTAALASAEMSASLYVQNPQTGKGGPATVESSVFVVRPHGLYMQCDFTLTFSARGIAFAATESVEVQSTFFLPEAATVTDLWLQIGTDSSQGLILDRGTASTTYEGIVRRRRDPCLLLKESLTKDYSTEAVYSRYTMKIYPMQGGGTRTVRFTYLLPVEWQTSGVKFRLPRGMFAMSTSSQETRLLVACAGSLTNPRLRELPDLTFTAPAESGGWAAGTISSASIGPLAELTLVLDWKTPRDVYFAGLSSKGEQFYQAAVFPGALLPSPLARKVAVLVDFDELRSWTTKQDMVASLQAFLKSTLGAHDSLNLLYSAADGMRWKWGQWTPAAGDGVDRAAAWLLERTLVEAPSLGDMLKSAVDYIRSTGGEGTILLLSSSTGYNRPVAADSVIALLKPWLTRAVPMSIADLTMPYFVHTSVGSKWYYNNEYFHAAVAGLTGGKYIRKSDVTPASLPAMLAALDRYLQNVPEAFDVYIAPSAGMTYARSSPLGAPEGAPTDWGSASMQIGKYVGSTPITLTATMLYQGLVYHRTFSIDTVERADTTLRQLWAGAAVRDLESNLPTYPYGTYYGPYPIELTSISMDERVLSRATAFLALEPGDTLRYCQGCGNTPIILGVADKKGQALTDTLVQIYPNPFNMSTSIRVRLPRGVTPGQTRVRVINTLGQVIKEFDAAPLSDSAIYTYVWDGRNDRGAIVSSGVYFFLLTSPRGTVGTRLLLTK